MVTGTAVRPLLDAARITPFLWLDDVYLRGLMAQKAGVNLYGSSRYKKCNSYVIGALIIYLFVFLF